MHDAGANSVKAVSEKVLDSIAARVAAASGAEASGAEAGITIRPAHPDSHRDTTGLARLMSRCYSGAFTVDGVESAPFWRVHVASRFISLLALDGTRIVGHLGLRADKDDPTVVQVVLPAVEPGGSSEIVPRLREELGRIASQRGWRTAQLVIPLEAALSIRPGEESFIENPQAILPSRILLATGEECHLLVETIPLSAGEPRSDVLHLPERSAAPCSDLTGRVCRAAASKSASAPVADLAGFSKSYRRLGSVEEVIVRTAFPRGAATSDPRARVTYYLVDLRESFALGIIPRLEGAGARLSGVLEEYRGSDFGIYTLNHHDAIDESLDEIIEAVTPRWKNLAALIQSGRSASKPAAAFVRNGRAAGSVEAAIK